MHFAENTLQLLHTDIKPSNLQLTFKQVAQQGLFCKWMSPRDKQKKQKNVQKKEVLHLRETSIVHFCCFLNSLIMDFDSWAL